MKGGGTVKFAIALFLCGIVTSLDLYYTHLNADFMHILEANPVQLAIIMQYGILPAALLRCSTHTLYVVAMVKLKTIRPRLAYVLTALYLMQQFALLGILCDAQLIMAICRDTLPTTWIPPIFNFLASQPYDM